MTNLSSLDTLGSKEQQQSGSHLSVKFEMLVIGGKEQEQSVNPSSDSQSVWRL